MYLQTNNATRAIKAKMKATWEDGDYASFADYMAAGAVQILEQWNLLPEQDLLDVGCGAGQSAIPAARMGHFVTGVDIAENLIQHAQARALQEGLSARFITGDAEDLPCETAQFDVAISMIGAMFAPNPHRVTAELARVIRPDGQLYMANWTPRSMPAQMFKTISRHVPSAPGAIPPVLWGDEDTVRHRLSTDFTDITLTRKVYPQWHYPFDADAVMELFRTQFGPVKGAFDKVDEETQNQLRQQLVDVYRSNGEYSEGLFTVTGGEYLEVIATRR